MNAFQRAAAGLAAATALLAGMGAIDGIARADESVAISIAGGRPGGLYHPVAGALCNLVNAGTDAHGITCTVEVGEGSVSNLQALRGGRATMALSQSDTQQKALTGEEPFEEAGPFEDLRSMFAVFIEKVTVVARADRGISVFEDLQGKRVNLPPAGSGGRVLMQRIMTAKGWDEDAVIEIAEVEAPTLAEALCDGEFDAFSVTVGHPSPLVREAANTCDVVLVPVTGPEIDRLIEDNPLYARSVVAAGMYRGNERDIEGLGLIATLVTTAEVSPEVVYEVTKVFFSGLDRLREVSPLFAQLTPEERIEAGLSAPLHDGAIRFFKEAGLM
jgi:uncharacterized protein